MKVTINPEKQAIIEGQKNSVTSREYLKNTDWYVSRLIETGKAIPADVLAKRAAARLAIK